MNEDNKKIVKSDKYDTLKTVLMTLLLVVALPIGLILMLIGKIFGFDGGYTRQ